MTTEPNATDTTTAQQTAEPEIIQAQPSQPIVRFDGTPAPRQSDATALLEMIERIARDPAVDLDRMERLFDRRDKVVADERRRTFNEAMALCQGELPQVLKNKFNKQTDSFYADLQAIGEVSDPVIARHGFALSFSQGKDAPPGCYRIICLLTHSGFEREYFHDMPIDIAGIKGTNNKTPMHAMLSTVSYGRRMLTNMIFNIKARDPDDDGNAAGNVGKRQMDDRAKTAAAEEDARPITPEQLTKVLSWMKQTKTPTEVFCNYYKIKQVAELPRSRFDEVNTFLAKKFSRMKSDAGKAKSDKDDKPASA